MDLIGSSKLLCKVFMAEIVAAMHLDYDAMPNGASIAFFPILLVI